jgi:hypothetical protein
VANRGVSSTGDNPIITFIVEEGSPTVVNNIDIAGNVDSKRHVVKSIASGRPELSAGKGT